MQVGIAPPLQYDKFNHANCMGCLKAGWQHWYIIYCDFPEIWNKAKEAEKTIGYSVHRDAYFEDKEEMFALLKAKGMPKTEKIKSQTFWAQARKLLKENSFDLFDVPVQESAVECIGDCGIDRE